MPRRQRFFPLRDPRETEMKSKSYKGFTIEHVGYLGPKPIAGIFQGRRKIHETWGDGDSWTDSVWSARYFIDDLISSEEISSTGISDLVAAHKEISSQMGNISSKYESWFDWDRADQRAYENLQSHVWKLNRELKAMGFKTWAAAYRRAEK